MRPAAAVPLALWAVALALLLVAQRLSPAAHQTVVPRSPPQEVAREPPAPAAAVEQQAQQQPAQPVRPCEGQFCSVGKLAPYRAGDLEKPGELERALRARSFRGELVLTYGDATGSAWVANLALSLRDVGIEHFLLLMMTDEACGALFDSPLRLSCGWSSWDMDGCLSQRTLGKDRAIERMWFIRHHLLARILALDGAHGGGGPGGRTLSVLALDGDVTVNAQPYAQLHAPAGLGRAHLVISLDNAPTALHTNNGLLYLRNCSRGGQAARVLGEVLRREADVCRHGPDFESGGAYFRTTDAQGLTAPPHRIGFVSAKDQKIYQDVLASAFCGRHVALRYEPAPAHIAKGRWEAYVRHFSGLGMRQLLACAAFEPVYRAGARLPSSAASVSHWEHALRLPPRPDAQPAGAEPLLVGVQLRGLPQGSAAQADAEGPPAPELAAAPGLEVTSSWHGTVEGETPGWAGHWASRPPTVSHFVGGQDKVAAMLALGWWRWPVERTLALLPAGPGGGRTALGAVEAPLQRHFRGGLPRVLALAGEGASGQWADYATAVRALGARALWLSALGSLLGRLALEPPVDCRSAWLVRRNNSAFGFSRRLHVPAPVLGLYQEVDERTRVGATLGPCAPGLSPPGAHPQGVCCSALFDKRSRVRERLGVHGLPAAHASLLSAVLAEPGATRVDVHWAELGLPLRGELHPAELERALQRVRPGSAAAAALVLHVERDMRFPPLLAAGLSARARESLCADLGKRCAELAPQEARALPVWPTAFKVALDAEIPGKLDPKSSVGEWPTDPRNQGA